MTSPIPQPKPSPVLGNLPDIDIHAPVQSMMRLAKAHGPIFKLAIGGRTVIVLSSQELVNEVCDESRFAKRLHNALVRVRDIGGDGLFTAYNDEPSWAKAHRLLAPAFGPLGIRKMYPRMLDIAEQMLVRWERFGADAVIDVADHMTRLTLDTIAICAFDVRFNSFYRDEPHPFVAAMGGALEEAGARARRPAIVSKLNLVGTRRYEADIKLLHGVADALIAERKADPDAARHDDLLRVLLEGRDPVTGEGLSDENIRYQIVTFLIAGHETTSGLLSFAIHLLLENPAILEQAQAEIDAVLGRDPPTVEDLARLPSVGQILQETLRLWPTAPAFAVSASEPTRIGGRYAVTPDDVLMVLAPMLHRDPAAWGEDAEEFRPKRFAPGAAEQLPPNSWKPFGNGERSCIGRGFAMQEAQLVLTLVLQRFDLTRADPNYALSIVETLTIKPHALQVRARRRGEPDEARARGLPEPKPKPEKAVAPSGQTEPEGERTPLLVLYGSNTGSCEAFAMRIASDAPGQGYEAVVAPMDEYTDKLPEDGVVLFVTASYEGRPPDNARAFMGWLDGVPSGELEGLRFAVFGCGNRQWARTYQAIPKQTDAALEAAGATRLRARGETDASGDFFGGFETWYAGLWSDLGAALGKEAVAPPQSRLDVEILPKGRAVALRLQELEVGTVIASRELVDLTSEHGRSKRHVEIALPEGMTYRAGDYLAVLPSNPRPTVDRVLRRYGLSADAEVTIRSEQQSTASLPLDHPVGLLRVLGDFVELDQPATRSQIAALAEATRCPPEQKALSALGNDERYEREILGKRVSLIDLLERFPSCELEFGVFLAALPAMRARQYSISSSPLQDPRICSLTVAVLDAPALSGQGRRLGVASNFLARLAPGERIPVAVRQSQASFHAPASPETPLLLVCAGTGLAPFRGFLQERAAQKRDGAAIGPALLFFGMMHPDVDYLYRDELAELQAEGVVDVRPAYSRAPEGDVRYVQHRLWQDRAEVAELFQRGAVTFVCGDGERMAPAVRDTFIRIYRDFTGSDDAAARDWAETVEREKDRYLTDVFA